MDDILDALPREYRDDRWIHALVAAIAARDDEQRSRADDIAAQILLATLTWGLDTEERLAGITPPAGATREERLAVLAARWRAGGKLDLDQIQRVCDAWKNGEVEAQYQGNRIHLKFVGRYGVPADMSRLLDAVAEIRPAHLAITYALRYILVREVQGMTIAQMQGMTMDKFAGGA